MTVLRPSVTFVLLTLVAGVAAACTSTGGGAPTGSDASSVDDSGGVDGATDGANADAGQADATDPIADDCVKKINAYRAMLSLPPVLSKQTEIACAVDQARKGALDLADSGKTTFHKYYGQCAESYQNECWYSVDDPAAVITWCLDAFWQEGPPDAGINHYSVMTDPRSTLVACGLHHMAGGGYWMTNDFY